MHVRGGAARPSEPGTWKKILAEGDPRRAIRKPNPVARFLDGLCSRSLVEAYLRDMADTDRVPSAVRSPNCWN